MHRGEPVPGRAELERMIYVERLTYQQVAQRYGADKTSVPYWLDRHGIPRPSRTRIEPEEVRMRYERGDSALMIARELGCSKTSVFNFLRRMNVSRRATGWRAPYRAADGTIVRSTYEERIADWLTMHGVSYEYEPRVPFGHGNTRADFLANGWYIEMWGIHSSQSYRRQRARKIKAYEAAGLPLIQLAPHHFSTRDRHILERRLRQCLTPPPS